MKKSSKSFSVVKFVKTLICRFNIKRGKKHAFVDGRCKWCDHKQPTQKAKVGAA